MELKTIFFVLFVAHLADQTLAKKVAGVVVFRRVDSRIDYLMLAPNKLRKDWTPPKGRIDEGEDAFTAALRELHEETGYQTDDLNIFESEVREIKRERRKGGMKKMTYWLAELKDIEKNPELSHEHSGFLWLTKDQIYWVHEEEEFLNMINDYDLTIRTLYPPPTANGVLQ